MTDVKTPPIRDLLEVVQDDENNLTFMKNVSIPLKASPLPIRANVPSDHRSKYSAWETPDPVFWTREGYAVVRADERGLGQSPGLLDTMSRGTSECFFDVVEWAAEQSWSSGKVGLLGILYYAGLQWRVAARKLKGLAAIIPWEGMSDYYRDRCRHGGILSNNFISFWWNRQVLVNQYGKAGRSKLQFPPHGPGARGQEDTIEGDLPEEVLVQNRKDQTQDNTNNKFRDDDYYASKEYNLEDIDVPLLSVANWGGILLHLRGNVEGYTRASSKFKYIRFITGRHDLPFYSPQEVEIQKSFLNAFLKGQDDYGWTEPGKVAPVTLTMRKGNRDEEAWPIPRTQYTKCPGNLKDPKLVQFISASFEEETEVIGHVTAHLNVSVTPDNSGETDIDLFVTLRHIDPAGKEVLYTGTAGDGIPLCKGWLRVSNRKVYEDHPKHCSYRPHREYLSADVQPVKAGEVYTIDVEVWPTNVVVEKGGKLVFEVSSGDTQGSGVFQHNSDIDRPASNRSLRHFEFRGRD
ncbi:Alpha/Beta hydrolase protein [Dactylonectria estremocensis]|uniref:Alpha/Beta hydrolase protein n=1 Tax=Dactylonectria estremocensis TaxID=1079267 RepID=A0A9P9EXI2_9HYPO|nr:Alpha/Beta hydrolase protein [Dactylonectria estremocensis]